MRVVARFALAALASAAAAAPNVARANGRFPAANQLVIAPSDAGTMIVRTTFGVLLSRDAGKSWDWICERVLDVSTQEDPAVGITADGTIVSGEFAGLMVSPDTGCSWSHAGGALGTDTIVDLVVRKDAPHTMLVLGSKFRSADDAGKATYASQLYASSDDGKTFIAVGAALDPSLLVETVEIAPSNPSVVYVSGIREGQGGFLLASTDGGITFREHPVPLDASHERAPFIAAVDPRDPNLVYVRTSGVQQTDATRLLVTKNAGASFDAVLTATGPLQGFAVTPDGAKVYAGGPRDGLYAASTSDYAFRKTNAASIGCLAAVAGTLYACSNEASGFFIGTSRDDGASFDALLHLSAIRGPLQCTSGQTTTTCAQDWPALADTLGIAPSGDAGAGDAGTPEGGGGAGKSCGCSTVGAPGSFFRLAGLGAAMAAVALALRGARLRPRIRPSRRSR